MSTRSHIAIELPSEKVKAIYVHSDGYPSGVGRILIDHYNDYNTAIKLFDFGDCSSLGDTVENCSFYSRDWNRGEENNTFTYNNEWCYWNDFGGNIHIEYLYLFKNGEWLVSEMSSHKNFDSETYIENYYVLHTNPIKVIDHEDFNRENKGMTEKEMISNIGEMLQDKFSSDTIVIQGQKMTAKEKLN
jgi:hypothetical protein